MVAAVQQRRLRGGRTCEADLDRVGSARGDLRLLHRLSSDLCVRPSYTDEMRSEAPLVGRELGLSELNARGERAAAGSGGLVLLAGEAGVGKTRLAAEALARLSV